MHAENPIPNLPTSVGRQARVLTVGVALLVSLLMPIGANGARQNASEILQEAIARQQARLAGVQNYTLTRRVNGRNSIAYYERAEVGGKVTFEPVSSLRLALQSGAFDDTPLAALAPGGNVLEGLRDMLVDAAVSVGAAALTQQIAAAAGGQVASLVDALIRPPQPGMGDGETLGSLIDLDAFKEALVEGALRAGMTQLASQVLGLPGDTGMALLEAVRGKSSSGELFGELSRSVLGGSAGSPPQYGGAPGRGGMPPMSGFGGSAMPGGNPLQAGIGALASIGGQLLARQTMNAVDQVLAPRYMNDIDFYSAMELVQARASINGSERVDGRKAWVINVDDLGGIDGAQALREGRMTLWLDTKRYVPLRAELEGETQVEGRWQPINVTMVRADYVDAEGMLFPSRSTITITGPAGNQGMFSDSERGELQEKIATGMRQFEKLPEQYRAMAQQMIGSRMAQLEGMMGSGPMEFDSTLIDVRVNAGPPEELVDQARILFAKPGASGFGSGGAGPPASGADLPWLRD